jgi:hypothetical protein
MLSLCVHGPQAFFAAQASSSNFRTDNRPTIDLAITWRKVNATKKIREFCLMARSGANENSIRRVWRERMFCGSFRL